MSEGRRRGQSSAHNGECERRTSDKAKGEVRVNRGLVGQLLELQPLPPPTDIQTAIACLRPDGPVPCTCSGVLERARRRMQRTTHTVVTSMTAEDC